MSALAQILTPQSSSPNPVSGGPGDRVVGPAVTMAAQEGDKRFDEAMSQQRKSGTPNQTEGDATDTRKGLAQSDARSQPSAPVDAKDTTAPKRGVPINASERNVVASPDAPSDAPSDTSSDTSSETSSDAKVDSHATALFAAAYAPADPTTVKGVEAKTNQSHDLNRHSQTDTDLIAKADPPAVALTADPVTANTVPAKTVTTGSILTGSITTGTMTKSALTLTGDGSAGAAITASQGNSPKPAQGQTQADAVTLPIQAIGATVAPLQQNSDATVTASEIQGRLNATPILTDLDGPTGSARSVSANTAQTPESDAITLQPSAQRVEGGRIERPQDSLIPARPEDTNTPIKAELSIKIEGSQNSARTPTSQDAPSLRQTAEAALPVRTADADGVRLTVKADSATITLDGFSDLDMPLKPTQKLGMVSMSGDTLSVPSSLSSVLSPAPLTPLTGMSDRLAATILQTTQTQMPVTLDKIPQAVVAIALSAKSATLQIDPPELGRIQLDYQFDSQGRTVVTLTPESDAARTALMDRMAAITAALEQGSNSPIDVKLGDARDFGSMFDQSAQDDEANGSGRDSRSDDTALTSNDRQTPLMIGPAPDGSGRLHMRV